MKQLISIYIIFSLCSHTLFAQQSPLYSLYMFNDFAINPAVAGTQKFNRAQLNNRYQFVGIENAPITASLSVFGGSASSPMGWGAMVYNDSQAAISKFGAYAAYAYHISIQKGLDLSFGLNAGLIQYTVDLTKIKFLEEEPYLDATKYNYIRPDGTIGAYLYSKDYYAGVSADQLFNNKLEMISDTIVVDNATLNRLKSHIIITGGYKYKLSYGFELEPNVVIRKTPKSPFQIEATARVGYKKAAWAGLSVRSGDAFSVLIGYNYRKILFFGYAYDITYSRLRKDTQGSHEVMMGIKFNERK